jgi:hypothetical protein
VQHGHSPGWHPTGAQGDQDGLSAVRHAELLGLPQGAQLWLDLEAIAPTPADRIVAHCNAWHDQVVMAGYRSGLYVGVPCGLNDRQLYEALRTTSYWRSLSGSTPKVDVRGYCLRQSATTPVHGIALDRNIAAMDNLGGSAWVLAPEGWTP